MFHHHGAMASRVSVGLARLHHLVGRTLEWCGWLGGAAHAYRDALRLDEAYAPAHFRLGEVLSRRGAWEEAGESFADAARLRPQSVEFQGNLVLALHRAGRGEDLAAALRRLTQLRPQEGELYVLLGAVLRKLKRHDEAIRAFRWAVRLSPTPATKRFFLGEALLGPRGWQEVLHAWQDARRVMAAMPGPDGVEEGWSRLNSHPGDPIGVQPPRLPAPRPLNPLLERLRRLQESLVPPDESFEAMLAREERTRAILHGYSEPASPPLSEEPRRSVGPGGEKRGAS